MNKLEHLLDQILDTLVPALTGGLLGVIFTAFLCYLVAKYVVKLVNRALDRSRLSDTVAGFLKPALRMVVYFLASTIVAQKLGFDTSSLVALVSVVSAAFALAAQDVLGNLFGGILMLWNKPFEVGHYIIFDGTEGTVVSISLFYTTVRTLDNRFVTVPNQTITNSVVSNCSFGGTRRLEFQLTVGFDVPIEAVQEAALEAVSLTEHTLREPELPHCRLLKFGEYGITYALRVWIDGSYYWDTYFGLNENIKRCFDAHGVEFCYPRMIVDDVQRSRE